MQKNVHVGKLASRGIHDARPVHPALDRKGRGSTHTVTGAQVDDSEHCLHRALLLPSLRKYVQLLRRSDSA